MKKSLFFMLLGLINATSVYANEASKKNASCSLNISSVGKFLSVINKEKASKLDSSYVTYADGCKEYNLAIPCKNGVQLPILSAALSTRTDGGYEIGTTANGDVQLLYCEAGVWKTGEEVDCCNDAYGDGTKVGDYFPCKEKGKYSKKKTCENLASNQNEEQQAVSENNDSANTQRTVCGTCGDAQHAKLNENPWESTQSLVFFDAGNCSEGEKGYYCNSKNKGKYLYAKIDKSASETDKYLITKDGEITVFYCDGSKWVSLERTRETGNDCTSICGNKVFVFPDNKKWSSNECTTTPVAATETDAPDEVVDPGLEADVVAEEVVKVEPVSKCECCEDDVLKRSVASAMGVLNPLKNAKKSVWTTEDGKFNTARLATDVASGAVMATVAGLVTNKVVKNKQLKDGMEGYYCTVASENVAGYGEEFAFGTEK